MRHDTVMQQLEDDARSVMIKMTQLDRQDITFSLRHSADQCDAIQGYGPQVAFRRRALAARMEEAEARRYRAIVKRHMEQEMLAKVVHSQRLEISTLNDQRSRLEAENTRLKEALASKDVKSKKHSASLYLALGGEGR